MADPASLVLGIAGLGGLFGTCLQLFEIIELGSSHERDFETTLCRLKVEKVRFLLWGENAGLWTPDGRGLVGRTSARLLRPEVQSTVLSVFTAVRTTFLRVSTLVDRYKSIPFSDCSVKMRDGDVVAATNDPYSALFQRVDSRQEASSIGRKICWAFRDKKLADELISTIRSFNDSLAALVPESAVTAMAMSASTSNIQSQPGETNGIDARDANILRSSGSRCLLSSESSVTRQLPILEQMRKHEQGCIGTARSRVPTKGTHSHAQPESTVKDPEILSSSHDMSWISNTPALPHNIGDAREGSYSKPESSERFTAAGKASPDSRLKMDTDPEPLPKPDVATPYCPPTCIRAIARQLQAVERDQLTCISIAPITDKLTKCRAMIKGPENTPYANGTFYLSVDFPSAYPFEPPKIRFLTRIYHFNVDHYTGDVCLENNIKGYWSPAMHISKVLLCIRDLLVSLNEEEPHLLEVAKLFYTDRKAYDAIAKHYTQEYATVCQKFADANEALRV